MPSVPAGSANRPNTPLCLATLCALLAATPLNADDARQADDQMRADCRAEGEAGGLEGADLEAFVRECVADLLSVTIENIDE